MATTVPLGRAASPLAVDAERRGGKVTCRIVWPEPEGVHGSRCRPGDGQERNEPLLDKL